LNRVLALCVCRSAFASTEDDAEASARFFGGLNHDIQNILDYKEWCNFYQLYHLATEAEQEV